MNTDYVEICPTAYHKMVEHTHEVWGWEIVVYLFLGGLVAGLLVLTAALELRAGKRSESRGLMWMPFVALALISLGMVALFLDLHYKVHFWRFYLAFKPASPMSWGAWILMVIYPAAFLLGMGSLSGDWRDRITGWVEKRAKRLKGLVAWVFEWADEHRRTLLWTNLGVGIGLGVYTGLLLGTMVARIHWNSAVLGPLFLSSGLSTGAAFMLLFKLSKDEQRALVRWDMLAIAAELFFIGLMLISFAGGNHAAQVAGESLLGGEWTAPFWTLVVMMGLVVPLLLETVEIKRRLPLTVVTPVLILIGGVSLRAILLASGQESCFCDLR
jgi:protein NrfD